jgi:hypothetical protein
MSVEIDTTDGLSAGPPVELFDTGLSVDAGLDQYAVAYDGQSILVACPVSTEESGAVRVVLVQNWFTELERLVPTN